MNPYARLNSAYDMVKGRVLADTDKILDKPLTLEKVGYVPSTKGEGKGPKEYVVFTVKEAPGEFFRCGGGVFVAKIKQADEIREENGHSWEQVPQVIITKKPSQKKGQQDYYDVAFLVDEELPTK